MASNSRVLALARPRANTYYERWMEKEGVPVIEGFGVSDVRRLSLKPWKRLGCDGAYLQLRGLEGITGVYVGRVAPGTMTEPERHLYEKIIYIIQGEGSHSTAPKKGCWPSSLLTAASWPAFETWGLPLLE